MVKKINNDNTKDFMENWFDEDRGEEITISSHENKANFSNCHEIEKACHLTPENDYLKTLLENLNQGQADALVKIVNKSHGMLLVEGHAGTGKSFLLRTALEVLKKLNGKKINGFYFHAKRLCMAPTHQALHQINTLTNDKIFTTVASYFHVRVYTDKKTGEDIFTPPTLSKNNIEEQHHFIFVDECSMISEKDFRLFSEISTYHTIIFLGDFAQLPPVKKKKVDFLNAVDDKIKLTEQMRNGDVILHLCNHFRDHTTIPSKGRGNVTIYPQRQAMMDELLKRINKNPIPGDNIYLAYTNRMMRQIRSEIKTYIYHDKIYPKDQWLRLEYINEQFEPSLEDGQNKNKLTAIHQIREGKVIASKTTTITLFDQEFTAYLLQLIDKDGNLICHTTPINAAAQSVIAKDKKWHLTLSFDDLDIIEHLKIAQFEKNRALFQEITERLPPNMRHGETQLEQEHKKGIFMAQQAQRITKALSPYSSTIHKAQGTTIKNVFLDAANILAYQNKPRATTKELLYVGASRASQHLYIHA